MSELLAEAASLLMAKLPGKSRGAVKDFLKRRPPKKVRQPGR
jgi:hypothetical protein